MATSIFFTESRDFKLIKNRILTHEDYYLVYVYADTSNIKIPKELIKELPIYGNNLIWVDTAMMDSSDITHHIVLTIGQLVDPEEEINFYLVSRSAKLEKTIIFLRNQGIPAELIAGAEEKVVKTVKKGTGKRGRPKKVKEEKAAEPGTAKKRGRPKTVKSEIPAETKAPKKRGRPKKEVVASAQVEAVPAAPKKRGRPAAAKPAKEVKPKKEKKVKEKKAKEKAPAKPAKKSTAKAKKTKSAPKKGPKPSRPRVEKPITAEEVGEKVARYQIDDSNANLVLTNLFGMKKTVRPKLLPKLVEWISHTTLEDDTVSERLINQMAIGGIIEIAPETNRITYKD